MALICDSFAHQDKVVLKNLNGYVKPGQFLAIIGPSGIVPLFFFVGQRPDESWEEKTQKKKKKEEDEEESKEEEYASKHEEEATKEKKR